MHGRFLAAGMDGIRIGTPAKAKGRLLDPIGEHMPDPLPGHHHFDKTHNGLAVSPRQLQPAGLFPGKDTRLIAFDGKSHGMTSADGVHTCPVEQFIQVKHGIHVFV